MKRIHQMLLLATLLLCSLMPAMAQGEHDPFHPMLQDGKMWHIDYSTSANIVGERHYIHYIDGDTVIEGQTWKKVYSNQATRYMEGNETTGNHYFAAMREVGNKIYAIAAGLQRPRLIYDFDMKVGDYVHHGYEQIDLWSMIFGFISNGDEAADDNAFIGNVMLLHKIDTISVAGHDLRRFTFLSDMHRVRAHHISQPNYVDGFVPIVWVEGVGSNMGLFTPFMLRLDCDVSCTIDGNTIFESSEFGHQTVDDIKREFHCPLVEDGKKWTYSFTSPNGEIAADYSYYLDGDTVVGGTQCKKLYSVNADFHSGDTLYAGALFEEEHKAYCFMPGEDDATLLFDFNMSAGDSYTYKQHLSGGRVHETAVYVNAILNSWDSYGRPLRFYNLCSDEYRDFGLQPYDDGLVIEGVGSMYDFFGIINPARTSRLTECSVDGEVLFGSDLPYTSPLEETYTPMAVEGRRWNYVKTVTDEQGSREVEYSYVVRGDTVIGGVIYKKLYLEEEGRQSLVFIMNEYGRWLHGSSYSSPRAIGDFRFIHHHEGLIPVYEAPPAADYVVKVDLRQVDALEIGGKSHPRLTFNLRKYDKSEAGSVTRVDDGPGTMRDILIEGIGSQLTGIEVSPVARPYTYKPTSRFVSCYQDDVCLLTASDFGDGIHDGIEAIENVKCKMDNAIFDIAGQRIDNSKLRKGIFIKNGKKVVVK